MMYFLLIFTLFWIEVYTNTTKVVSSLSEIFQNGRDDYLIENWDGCVENFNLALHEYKTHKNLIIKCRDKCRTQTSVSNFEDIEDLKFYDKKVRETWCLMNCNQDYINMAGGGGFKKLSIEFEYNLIHLKPYEYLSVCYYKKKDYQMAANTIYTYLIENPAHEMSKQSLKYYLSKPGVEKTKLFNFEESLFVESYKDGVIAYENEYWDKAIYNLEKSLRLYIESEEGCRYYCEGPFDQGWHPEFTSSIANHFTYCLKCKRACSYNLNNIDGERVDDLLPKHYNYLQFAYYKKGKIRSACGAVGSYLMFDPVDEIMLRNKDYYISLPKVEEKHFQPREEAIRYVKRQEYELKILGYISEEFEIFNKEVEVVYSNK